MIEVFRMILPLKMHTFKAITKQWLPSNHGFYEEKLYEINKYYKEWMASLLKTVCPILI